MRPPAKAPIQGSDFEAEAPFDSSPFNSMGSNQTHFLQSQRGPPVPPKVHTGPRALPISVPQHSQPHLPPKEPLSKDLGRLKGPRPLPYPTESYMPAATNPQPVPGEYLSSAPEWQPPAQLQPITPTQTRPFEMQWQTQQSLSQYSPQHSPQHSLQQFSQQLSPENSQKQHSPVKRVPVPTQAQRPSLELPLKPDLPPERFSLDDLLSHASNALDSPRSVDGYVDTYSPLHLEFRSPSQSTLESPVPQSNTGNAPMLAIPPELLPPMPVPVDRMSGLKVDGDHYTMQLDLPVEQSTPFSVEQLTIADFNRVENVWSISCLSQWVYELGIAHDNLSVPDVQSALSKLFAFKAETGWEASERAAKCVIESLKLQRFIGGENELVLRSVPVSGVVTELTCYTMGECYAPHTHGREPEPVNQAEFDANSDEMNWRKFWNLQVGDTDGGAVKLQFALHELIMSEVAYVRDLRIYLDVYGEIELLEGLTVMSEQQKFVEKVFGKVRRVLEINMKLLLELQALQRLGPYVSTVGVCNAVYEWSKLQETIDAYTSYSDDYLWAEAHIRKELTSNTRLQQWMEARAKDERLGGRPHSFFFHRILPRVARYHLLLGAVLKYTKEEDQREVVERAISGVTQLTQLCDDRVARQKAVQDVQNLKAHIVFKSSAVAADLQLSDRRRKLLREGNLLRRGDMRMEWVDTHVLLLDNFFVLSKTREGMNGTAFYITKPPIPLDLLVIESVNMEGVTKVSTRLGLTRHSEDAPNEVFYPIKLSHLGAGRSYVLFAATQPERTQWADAIVAAKQSRAQLAFARSAEPFRVEFIADGFAYQDTVPLPVPIPSTPLFRAVNGRDVGDIIAHKRVNCMIRVGDYFLNGTEGGAFVTHSKTSEVFGTGPTIFGNVRKMECMESLNLLLVLVDNNLLWFPLDQVMARGLGDRRHPIGIRLNQHRRVIDFAIAFHIGRVVVVYLQAGLLKVIEPIRAHGARPMPLVQASACISSFREMDRMVVPNDTYKVQPFLKCLMLATSKHFEWATLDTKRPVRVPVGKTQKETQFWGRPIRAIKLDGATILLCYESCYVICDTAGQIGIQQTTWFIEKVSDCAYYAPYLVLFAASGELVEIRYVLEFPGRLVQIVTARDIKLLSTTDDVFVRLAHPWQPGRQLLLELVGNEAIKDSGSAWYSSSSGTDLA